MRTIAGRIVRELLRKLPSDNKFRGNLKLCLKFVNGKLVNGHKIYPLHEPDVLCISKGKERKKYEFGNKVSTTRLWNGLIIGALSFKNEYDEHTVDSSQEQVRRIYGKRSLQLMHASRLPKAQLIKFALWIRIARQNL